MAITRPKTTPVERYLQISVALLAAVGTIILGFGQRSATLPVMAIFAAATAVYFSDYLGWFRLHRHLANAAAVLALLLCGNDFYVGSDSRAQLFAIANLLIYLQFVLLYQKKNVRLYWQLIVLSLLQVVVSAALNLGVQFGILLAIYLVIAIAAMTLAYLHQELLRLGRTSHANEAIRWKTSTTRDSDGRGGAVLQWSIDAPPVAFQLLDRKIGQRLYLGWALVRRVAAFSAATLTIAVSVFLAAPRPGQAWWRGKKSPDAMVGFAEEITLGEIGEALLSSKVALRVRLVDVKTGKPLFLSGGPYLRGAVLTHFDIHGRSISWRNPRRRHRPPLAKLPPPQSSDHLVRQEFVIQPSGRRTLFGVYPPLALEQTPDAVRYNTDQEKLVRTTPAFSFDQQPFRYVLGANSIKNSWQSAITPAAENAATNPAFLGFEASQFPNLRRIANAVVDDREVDRNDIFQVARALEMHFWNSDLYTYTLDQTQLPPPPAGMNLVEHFVANHRQGHCEYFATSLALMLRSMGIPSRVVVGYHGGDFNSIGKFYQVRDLHAHAWVEAYLPPRSVPEHLNTNNDTRHGAWLRLDPTPSSSRTDSQRLGVTQKATDTFDYMEALWNDYVLNLDSDQQRRAIYEPLGKNISGLFNKSVDERAWSEFFNETTRTVGVDTRNWWGSRWFDWSAALVISVAGGVCVALVNVFRLPTRVRLQQRRKLRARRRVARKRIDFFHDLESLLTRFHFCRKPSQTIQELTQEVAVWIGSERSAAALHEIAASYYRVRFGGATLSETEKSNIGQSLTTLENKLESRRDELAKKT